MENMALADEFNAYIEDALKNVEVIDEYIRNYGTLFRDKSADFFDKGAIAKAISAVPY